MPRAGPLSDPQPAHATPAHPAVFMALIAPFGVTSGYLSVAIVYLLTQAGVAVDQVAALVAVTFLPQTWKFLWAPVVDTTLTRKRWYLLASVVTAAGILAMGLLPATAASLPALYVAAFLANVATTFLAMATESLMVLDTPAKAKGRASGWFQAGNLGGAGVGGGAGLWLAQALPAPWMAGAALAVACLACALVLRLLREPVVEARTGSAMQVLRHVLVDLWQVARSRPGALALLICFLPIGTGAAAGLWSAVADDWHASAATVALVTGVASGFVAAAGCLAGGWLCDRLDRKTAYALFGGLLAACALGMALAPRTEAMYIVFTTVYSFISGLSYAAFTAVVLEVIGHGAVATKYNVFASLSNTPIAYMTMVDGWAHAWGGAGGMLYVEAAVGVVAMLFFMAVSVATRPRAAALAPRS